MRESLKKAQNDVDTALELAVSNACPINRSNVDLSAYVVTAILETLQAQKDLDDLGKVFK